MLLAIPSGVVSPLIVRHIFDVVLPAEDVRLLVALGGALVGLTILLYGLRYAHALLSITLRNRVRYCVTRDIVDHTLRLPLAFFDGTETGELMSRVRDDVGGLDGIMSDTLVGGVVDVLRALLFLTLLLVLDPGLALAGFTLVAVLFAGIFVVSRRLRQLSAVAREADARSSAALLETLSGLVTVRTTAQAPRERSRFMATVKRSIRAAARRDVLGRATGTAFGLVGVLGAYVIIAVGAYRILLGQSTFGGLFAFFIYLSQLMGSAGGVSGLVPAIQRSLASLQRIWTVLDQAREVDREGAAAPARSGDTEFAVATTGAPRDSLSLDQLVAGGSAGRREVGGNHLRLRGRHPRADRRLAGRARGRGDRPRRQERRRQVDPGATVAAPVRAIVRAHRSGRHAAVSVPAELAAKSHRRRSPGGVPVQPLRAGQHRVRDSRGR